MKEFFVQPSIYVCVIIMTFLILPIFVFNEYYFGNKVSARNIEYELSLQTNSSVKEKKKMKGKTGKTPRQAKSAASLTESWGGAGIGLIVEANSVKIEYDCAAGEIDGKLMVDPNGNFTMKGVYIRRYPGALRVKVPPKRQPALYEGKISGDTMTLKVTLTETKEMLEEITLGRGKTPKIRRCF